MKINLIPLIILGLVLYFIVFGAGLFGLGGGLGPRSVQPQANPKVDSAPAISIPKNEAGGQNVGGDQVITITFYGWQPTPCGLMPCTVGSPFPGLDWFEIIGLVGAVMLLLFWGFPDIRGAFASRISPNDKGEDSL